MSSSGTKAFTLIELLAVIVILAIIALISSPIIINLIENARKESFKDTTYGIIDAGENLYAKELLNSNDFESITFSYANGVESSSLGGKKLDYNGAKPRTGTVIVNGDGKVAIAIHNGIWCTEKGFDDSEVTLNNKTSVQCVIDALKMSNYDIAEGINRPRLTTGLTPIKWNGTSWDTVSNPETDTTWYNYANKEWANAQTADGSYWVWIPRFVYQIEDGLWHSDYTGTIDVQFSMGIDDTRGGTVTLDEGTTANASHAKWTNHPAFTFGTTELTGIWVAKFEPSVSNTSDACYTSPSALNCNKDTLIPKFVPNVKAWNWINVNNIFTVSRNMETNSVYGWGTTGDNIDTHMIKNTEWGAVTYLSNSVYGPNNKTVMNGDANYYTGGGTANAYIANTTQSTTYNVTGIYDMSGCSMEYTAAYVNNGDSRLSSNGNSLYVADAKYKDVYPITTDSNANNYNNAINIKGDGVYETSNNYEFGSTWYFEYTYMPYGNTPWFQRGGDINYGASGLFFFYNGSGGGGGFRVVLDVDDEL